MATGKYKPRAIKPIAERFWPKVDRRGPEDCWEWTAARMPTGYGKIGRGRGGAPLTAHRVSWELAFGPIPDGLFVLHHCDNPPCVNPLHLFLGTQTDNMADRDAKGRVAHGDSHYARRHPNLVRRGEAATHAKLTEAEVRAIRSDPRDANTLAVVYGILPRSIRKIRQRTNWKHVL